MSEGFLGSDVPSKRWEWEDKIQWRGSREFFLLPSLASNITPVTVTRVMNTMRSQATWMVVLELRADLGTVLVDGSATSFHAWHSHQYPSPLWYSSTSSRDTSMLACFQHQQIHHHHNRQRL